MLVPKNIKIIKVKKYRLDYRLVFNRSLRINWK